MYAMYVRCASSVCSIVRYGRGWVVLLRLILLGMMKTRHYYCILSGKYCGPKKGRYNISTGRSKLRHVLRGFGGPAGCPLAWWWHAWRGWHTSLCLRKDQLSKLRWLPEEPWRQSSGIGDQSWSPVRFLSLDAGRAVFWSGVQCSSGNDGFLSGRRFLACICEASLHRQLLVRSFLQPW